jgi:hypothetical protein
MFDSWAKKVIKEMQFVKSLLTDQFDRKKESKIICWLDKMFYNL